LYKLRTPNTQIIVSKSCTGIIKNAYNKHITATLRDYPSLHCHVCRTAASSKHAPERSTQVFLVFLCLWAYAEMFPTLQVATACLSCRPPYRSFIRRYMVWVSEKASLNKPQIQTNHKSTVFWRERRCLS